MRETITINRIIICSLLGKDVAQQISAYSLTDQEHSSKSEILTKYCSGEPICKSADCQFVIGVVGKSYSKPLQSIYIFMNADTVGDS